MIDPKQRLEYEVRLKHPKRGYETDYANGRKSAIYLMCISCMGDMISEVSKCTNYTCPLWRYRPGSGNRIPPKGSIPTKEEYEKLLK